MTIRKSLLVPFLVLATFGVLSGCNQGFGRGTPPPVACTPNCYDRECGGDGCLGSCGECSGDRTCNVLVGRCVGGDDGLVKGRLQFEYRTGVVGPYGVELADAGTLAGRNMWAVVADATGNVIGAREILGSDGSFAVPVSKPLDGTERLLFTALWAPAPANELLLAVLRRTEDVGTDAPQPVWSWTRTVPRGGDAGTITVTTGDGSAAMFLYLITRRAMDALLESVLGGSVEGLIRLAVLWAPGAQGFCGACFSPDTSPKIQMDGVALQLRQSIFISDDPAGAGAWGFPVLLHEFGHYTAKNYSRDDSPGGPHGIGELLYARFAWSEGWASFHGAMTATQWFGTPQPVYWDIQGGESFWIDFEAGNRWDGSTITLPSRNAGMIQSMDESFVTLALWSLWEGKSGTEVGDGSGLTADAILRAITSMRFVHKDRASPGADLADFLDAAACNDPTKTAQLKDLSYDDWHFPWDGDPLCMGGTAADAPQPGPGSRPASPRPPLSVDLRVRERGQGLDVQARAVARGPLPGPVLLEVSWPDVTAVGGQAVATLTSREDGTLPEVRLTVPAAAGRVRVVATAHGPGSGASAVAYWPTAPARPPAVPHWIELPPIRVSGTLVTSAVSLDRP